MALTQSQAKAPGTGDRAQFVGPAIGVVVLIVAVAMVAVLAVTLTAKSTGGSIVTSQADPFVQQGAIQFRAAEHAAGAAGVDPFPGKSAIDLPAAGAAVTDPFLSKSAIQFRLDEHPPADPLIAAPGRRAGEH